MSVIVHLVRIFMLVEVLRIDDHLIHVSTLLHQNQWEYIYREVKATKDHCSISRQK